MQRKIRCHIDNEIDYAAREYCRMVAPNPAWLDLETYEEQEEEQPETGEKKRDFIGGDQIKATLAKKKSGDYVKGYRRKGETFCDQGEDKADE